MLSQDAACFHLMRNVERNVVSGFHDCVLCQIFVLSTLSVAIMCSRLCFSSRLYVRPHRFRATPSHDFSCVERIQTWRAVSLVVLMNSDPHTHNERTSSSFVRILSLLGSVLQVGVRKQKMQHTRSVCHWVHRLNRLRISHDGETWVFYVR